MRRTRMIMSAMAFGLAVAAFAGVALGQSKSNVLVNGAGASFPYPLYAKWADQYEKMTGVRINYQSIGSGGGIAQIKARTVDFGASDAPLTATDLAEAGLVQFPMIIGGIVPVVNIKGVVAGKLLLTPEVLADIFLGKITSWDDPRIAAGGGVALPKVGITVVRRADGSGSTWLLTNYLSRISSEWKDKVGAGSSVSWPTGVGGKGNEGVAAYVQRIDGAIGYVEYAYAVQSRIPHARLVNRAGKAVSPSIESFQAAAANADWRGSAGYYVVLVDQPGEASWPITGASFILVHKSQGDATRAAAMLEYFDWCLTHGGPVATELDYVPLPTNVVELVRQTWMSEVSAGGKAVWRK